MFIKFEEFFDRIEKNGLLVTGGINFLQFSGDKTG